MTPREMPLKLHVNHVWVHKSDTGAAKMNKRRKKRRRPTDEGSYVCPTCGEQVVIPLDRSGGNEQQYVEDCPVCCNPNVIHVELFDEGSPRVWADAE